jgi:hypothetical protein
MMRAMVGARLAVVLALAGCGRLGFDAAGDGMAAGAGSDAGAADGAGPAQVLFSDDFETPIDGAWSYHTPSAVSESSVVHGGGAALQTTTANADDVSQAGKTFSAQGVNQGRIGARAWFYAPAGFTSGHIDLLRLHNALPNPYEEATIVTLNELVIYTLPIDKVQHSALGHLTLPADRWVCLELDIDIASTGGEIRMRCNDREIARVADIPTQLEGGYAGVDVGQAYLAAGQASGTTLYVDDVVVAAGAVGCGASEPLPACN